MDIYHYSALNGEFLGVGEADPDPLVHDNWLYPANSTLVVPPDVTLPDTVARFLAGSWSVVPDLRGTKYWLDGVEHVILTINETVPDGASNVAPPEVPGVLTSTDVNTERDRRVLLGSAFTLTGYNREVHLAGDAQSRENLSERKDIAKELMEAGDVTSEMVWRDELDFVHLLTPPQMRELWFKGVMYVDAIYQASWPLKDNPAGVPDDYKEDHHWPS